MNSNTTVTIPINNLPKSHLCFNCKRCCEYICLEIDKPTSFEDIHTICWYLYHDKVTVYIDADYKWYLQIFVECSNLTPEGICSDYENRPVICRKYDPPECEGYVIEKRERHLFTNAVEFMHYIKNQRPSFYKKFKKHFQQLRELKK